MVDLYLNKGYGTNQIANYLNENTIATKTSKLFKTGYTLKAGVSNRRTAHHVSKNESNPGSINTMFKNELYYGKRKFKISDDNFEYVDCEPIIDKDTFDKIQKLRVQNGIMKKRRVFSTFFKDLVSCGNCVGSFHGRVKPNRGEYTYRCNSRRKTKSTCSSRGINITKLNNVVWNAFKSSVFYHKVIIQKMAIQLSNSDDISKRLEELQAELAVIQKKETNLNGKLKKLIRKDLDTRISKEIYEEILTDIQAEAKLLADNKLTCQANIKLLTQKSYKNKEIESELAKGLYAFPFF